MKKFLSVILMLIMITGMIISTYAKENMPVDIKAKSAVLIDADSGKVLLKYNENQKLPPASVTKLMTVLLTCEALNNKTISFKTKIAASPTAAAKGGSQIWLKEGEVMTVSELLKATCVSSANDACTALAEQIAGSEEAFVNLMNEKAQSLGMKNTHFENCTGLDDTAENHYSSAYDIALMSRQVLKNKYITNFTTIWMDSLRNGKTELVNTNKLVRFYKGITGLKTGMTAKAGFCVSASAKRDDTQLIAVVMGSSSSSDRFETAKALLNWGFANYKTVVPEIDKKLITDVEVISGVKNSIKPVADIKNKIFVKQGDEKNIKKDISLAVNVKAPVEKNQVLGTITYSLNGEKLSVVNLLSPEKIDKLTFKILFLRLIGSLIC